MLKELADRFKTYSEPHALAQTNLLNFIFWKTGILRRFFGERKRFPRISHSQLHQANVSFRIPRPKAALICATGTSLDSVPSVFLDDIQNWVSIFSVNHFPLTKPGSQIRIDYQLLLDNYFFQKEAPDDAEMQFRQWLSNDFQGIPIIPHWQSLGTHDNTIRINTQCLPTFTNSINPLGIVGFFPYTTLYGISVAIWLGYSPIFLIGFDADQHRFIRVTKDGTLLKSHHAYNSMQEEKPWKGRNSATAILTSNALLIDSCKLFANYEVYILGNGGSVDTFKRLEFESVHQFLEK